MQNLDLSSYQKKAGEYSTKLRNKLNSMATKKYAKYIGKSVTIEIQNRGEDKEIFNCVIDRVVISMGMIDVPCGVSFWLDKNFTNLSQRIVVYENGSLSIKLNENL